jgi:hypothetical protein
MNNTAVPSTPKKDKTAPPAETSSFLFVNETGGATSYKQGTRREVRAHVRKVNAKKFGITHKGPRKPAERLPKYAPLTTKGADSGASTDAEHDGNCSSNALKIGRGLSTDSSPLSGSRSLIEIIDSPSSTTAQSTELETPPPPEYQREQTSYCKACGALLNRSNLKQRWPSKDQRLISTKSTNAKPDLVGILGAGRLDPFSTLPMEEPSLYSQELLDHGKFNFSLRCSISLLRTPETHALLAITYTLPGLWPDPAPRGEPNPLSKAWFTSSLRMPLLFHALVYSGSNHLDYMRHSAIYPNAPKPLSHKLIVIQKLNAALSDPEQALRDEVILAILILASQEVFMTKRGRWNPFNSPLQNLGWLNVYGNFKFVPQHTKAVADIITMRGGLETIKLHGLADIIAS